jgi:glycogen debranching enzyme
MPRGCIAQAWTVAEALRAYHILATERRRARRTTVRSRAAEAVGRM